MARGWFRFSLRRKFRRNYVRSRQGLVKTYQTLSTASVDVLWQKVVNLADVSWHPLLMSTNVPQGLAIKPGLIYRAVMRWLPISVPIFVESVRPQQLLTVRVLALPGLEERVTYQVESTVWGTQVSYSVTLRGWLSPLVWSVIRPFAAKVASKWARSAEQSMLGQGGAMQSGGSPDCFDF